jgi:hypothetical protein
LKNEEVREVKKIAVVISVLFLGIFIGRMSFLLKKSSDDSFPPLILFPDDEIKAGGGKPEIIDLSSPPPSFRLAKGALEGYPHKLFSVLLPEEYKNERIYTDMVLGGSSCEGSPGSARVKNMILRLKEASSCWGSRRELPSLAGEALVIIYYLHFSRKLLESQGLGGEVEYMKKLERDLISSLEEALKKF